MIPGNAFPAFASSVEAAGLIAKNHGNGHWQIIGRSIVNFYANTGRIHVNGKGKSFAGGPVDAIMEAKKEPSQSLPPRSSRREWTPEEIKIIDSGARAVIPIIIDIMADNNGSCKDGSPDVIPIAAAQLAYEYSRALFICRDRLISQGKTNDGSNADNPAGATSTPDAGSLATVSVPVGFGDGYALPTDVADHRYGILDFLSTPEARDALSRNREVFFRNGKDGYEVAPPDAIDRNEPTDRQCLNPVRYMRRGIIRADAESVGVYADGRAYFRHREQ